MSKLDKFSEMQRYDAKAKDADASSDQLFWDPELFVQQTDKVNSPINKCYIDAINSVTHSHSKCLELGAGFGRYTFALLNNSMDVVASDISVRSLDLLLRRYKRPRGLVTCTADIEDTGLPSSTFDVITSAGALSYGDNELVRKEVLRLLKPGSYFIAIDSLNDNLIYRLNRYIRYLRGERTLSTLRRMPNLRLLRQYASTFSEVKFYFYGSFAWAYPILSTAIGGDNAVKFLQTLDLANFFPSLSFKFVMVARK